MRAQERAGVVVETGGVTVMIVATPGPVGDGIEAVLTAIPHVTLVDSVGDAALALARAAALRPGLVVLDDSFPGEAGLLAVRQIKAAAPGTRGIVLVDDVRGYAAAVAGGADAVLLKGSPAAELFALVERWSKREGGAACRPSTGTSQPRRSSME